MANDLTTLAKRLRPLISGVTHSIVVELVEGGLTGIHNHQEDAQGGKIDHGLGMIGTSLLDDDHTQYLNETRHDTTTRHTLGTVVPHDSHSGLTGVTANQHHNQVHGIVSSDHTVTGAALSVIGLSAINTLGVLVPSSDVGTTPAAAILKSTTAGGLTLGTLTVKGAVDITQDLTVGANVLLVDVSGNNVGIAGAPDPQFALDVNGPFHADAIYGPLGRLLKDCIFLAHYDGPPSLADYSGSPQTVQGQIPTTLSGGVVYRPGVYGKALQAGRAAGNSAVNPVFGHPTDWDYGWTTNVDITSEQNTDPRYVYYGASSAKVTRTGAGGEVAFRQTITAGNTGGHILSVYVKKADGSAPTASEIKLVYGTVYDPEITALGDGWYMLHKSVSGITSATSTGVAIYVMSTPYYIGGMSFLSTSMPSGLVHGGMGPGHSWSGIAHESTSARTSTQVIYTGVTMPAQWSIGFWFQPWTLAIETIENSRLFEWADSSNNRFSILYLEASDILIVDWRGNGSATSINHTDLVRGQKYHIAATYDGTTLKFYIDGALIGSATPTAMTVTPTILGISNTYTGTLPVNGLVDDAYLLKSVQSQDDIKAIIDSEVPVAAEHGVTSWYSGGIAPIWVDSDGMWMRDVDANPVFGWSAINGKSWGGLTLDMGDNLIGRYGSSLGGWQQWDRSAGKLVLGFDTTGAIQFYAGNAEIIGKLKMPGTSSAIAIGSTPPTAANAGTGIWIDRTGIYGLLSDTYQVKMDAATGALLAAAGDIKIGGTGFRIYPEGSPRNSTKIRWLTNAEGDAAYIAGLINVASGISNLIEDTTALSAGGYATVILRANNYGSAAAAELDIYASSSEQYAAFKNQLRVDGGLYVGSVLTAPTDNSIVADGGIYLGRSADPGAGNVAFTGVLKSYKNTTEYSGYIFVPLAAPLTSTSWDGDARSTTAKTLIDLSAVFGAPAGIKAVALKVRTRDSASAANETYMVLGPANTADVGIEIGCAGLANDKWSRDFAIVTCDANGDIYYQIVASGASTFDVVIEIWGYLI